MDRKEWKQKLYEAVKDGGLFGDAEFNADAPPCPDCGNTMIFYGHDENGDFPPGEAYWQCPVCRYRYSEYMLPD